MASMIIIDPSVNARNTLQSQLQQLGDHKVARVKNYEDGRKKILSDPQPPEIAFLTFAEGIGALSQFVGFLRQRSQATLAIVVVEGISLEEMRELLGLGVDQILMKPFNVDMLKAKIVAADKFRKQVRGETPTDSATSDFDAQVEMISQLFYKVVISGWLTENCVLPKIIPAQKGATLFLDCDRLAGINSVGTRSWILWLRALEEVGFGQFQFERLRRMLLKQAGLIQGFIPAAGTVNSFHLCYDSEELGLEKEVLISINRDFTNEKMVIPRYRRDVEDGKTVVYEVDDSACQNFGFYRGKIEFKD